MSTKKQLLKEREERIISTFHNLNQRLDENTMTEMGDLNEGQYDDLFNFIEQNPAKGSVATVQYSSLVAMNKNIIGPDANGQPEKQPNPMWGKVTKHQRISFRWEDTYKRALERDNPDYEIGARSGTYEKQQGYEMLENGKSGLYLPVMPLQQEAAYSVDGSPISKEELIPYFKPSRPYTPSSGQQFRALIVDKIYAINSGGNTWQNPHYTMGPYVGPK